MPVVRAKEPGTIRGENYWGLISVSYSTRSTLWHGDILFKASVTNLAQLKRRKEEHEDRAKEVEAAVADCRPRKI